MDPIPSDADDTSKLHKTQVHNTTQHKTKFDDARSLSLSNLSFFQGLKLFFFGFPLMKGENKFLDSWEFLLSPLATTLSSTSYLSDCRRSKRLILIYLPSICNKQSKQSQQEPGGHLLLLTHNTHNTHKFILSLLVLPTKARMLCLDS